MFPDRELTITVRPMGRASHASFAYFRSDGSGVGSPGCSPAAVSLNNLAPFGMSKNTSTRTEMKDRPMTPQRRPRVR